MPFIAMQKATGEQIDITAIENPRAALTSGECLCQLCGTPMIVKAGLVRQHHFAHIGRCTSDYQSYPESPAHREAKRYLATHLREWFGEYAHTHIAYEVPIPEVKRIADLLVTFPTGWRVAHEVQLASITTEHLQERTSQVPAPWTGRACRQSRLARESSARPNTRLACPSSGHGTPEGS